MSVVLESLDATVLADWRAGLPDRLVAVRVGGGIPEAQARQRVGGFLTRHDPAGAAAVVRRVVADGEPAGHLYADCSPDRPPLLVELDLAPELAAPAVAALADELRTRGATELHVSAFPGDAATAALVAATEPRLAATNMKLDLAAPTPEERLRLVPMSDEQFAAYLAVSVQTYAHELFESGGFASPEEALARAREQMDEELLPDGLATPGHHLWRALAGSDDVGLLWVFAEGDWSFIYDIEVDESLRGQGFGSALLRAGANAARDAGAAYLGLNVFGQNEGAHRLYERAGYDTIEQFWILSLH